MDDATAAQIPEGWRSLRILGSGEKATVHLAVHELTGQEVALKVWRTPTAEFTVVQREQFRAQACLLSRMTPPDHVVEYRWSGLPEEGHPWLATALYECSLGERVAAGRLDLVELLDIADDLLTGLAALHREGFVHRDVSPSNVLLKGHAAVLSDLGMAVPCESATHVAPAGTWGFTAPEAGFGGYVDRRSDVYAAARTIRAASPFATPVWLQAALAKALSENPSRRPADADAFRRLLTAARIKAGLPRGALAPATRSRLPRSRGALVVLSTMTISAISLTVALTSAATPVAETQSTPPAITFTGAAPQLAWTSVPAPDITPSAVPLVAATTTTTVTSSRSTSTAPTPTVSHSRTPIEILPSVPINSSSPAPSGGTDPELTGKIVVPMTPELADPDVCDFKTEELHEVTGTTAETSTDIRMDRSGTYGYVENGEVKVGYAASYTGTPPTSGALYYFVRAEKGRLSDGGDESNGVIYRAQPVTPDAKGCYWFPDTLTDNADNLGWLWDIYLVYVPDSALETVKQSEDGWSSFAETPAGIEPLSWFQMDTNNITRAPKE